MKERLLDFDNFNVCFCSHFSGSIGVQPWIEESNYWARELICVFPSRYQIHLSLGPSFIGLINVGSSTRLHRASKLHLRMLLLILKLYIYIFIFYIKDVDIEIIVY